MDPYFDTQRCIKRLLDEYHKHGKLIIAIDFDDTVFDYHQNGHEHDGVINMLKRCQALDFWMVVWTAAPEERHDSQVQYLNNLGITIHSVNENPLPLPYGNHGKIYYNLLLDDRAGLGQAFNILSQVVSEIEEEKNYNQAHTHEPIIAGSD
jgi:hypothetical protein